MDNTEEDNWGEHVERSAKDLSKQYVMVPIAQPKEAISPNLDDKKSSFYLMGCKA